MKQKHLDTLKNVDNLLICVDLDGTLCHGEFWGRGGEPDPDPNEFMVGKMWEWYLAGAHLIIYTARQPKFYPQTHGWLVKHHVPFHGICMTAKPGADLYIDDKSLNVSDLLEKEF